MANPTVPYSPAPGQMVTAQPIGSLQALTPAPRQRGWRRRLAMEDNEGGDGEAFNVMRRTGILQPEAQTLGSAFGSVNQMKRFNNWR